MRSFVAFAVLALSLASGAPQQYYSIQQPAAAVAAPVQQVAARTLAKPIAIVRSINNAPGTPGFDRTFDSDFEAENGIKQEVNGEMRLVDDAEVMVMRGSYTYVGDDSQTYTVNWYADETGFHAEADHLPKSVPIPFPEQAAAVEAQVRFAEQESRSAEASGGANEAYVAAPAPAAVAVRTPAAQNSYANQQQQAPRAAPQNNYANQQQQTARTSQTSYATSAAAPVEVVPVRNAARKNPVAQKQETRSSQASYATAPAAASVEAVQVRAQAAPAAQGYAVQTVQVRAPVQAAPAAQGYPVEAVQVRAPVQAAPAAQGYHVASANAAFATPIEVVEVRTAVANDASSYVQEQQQPIGAVVRQEQEQAAAAGYA